MGSNGRASQDMSSLRLSGRELLEKRLRGERVNGTQPPSIIARASKDYTPLSFAQQRIWFFDQLEPGSAVYNRPSNIRLTGSLHAPALEQALNEIVRRHEVVRTAFVAVDGTPHQVVAPLRPLTLRLTDLQHSDRAETEESARRIATEEARRPFDLRHDPLLRATLLRLGEEDHLLLLTMHHIVFDAWSMNVLLRELSLLYQAYAEGKPSPLPELRIQYGDFAAWQREKFEGDSLNEQVAYWRRQMAGAPPVLELLADHPRPPVLTSRGAHRAFTLPQNLNDKLKALGRAMGVTPFMMFLAAFQVLLHRYSGQDDIVVGAPIAGRTRTETEGLIGCFINTLVLRTDLSGDPTFEELLRRVRRTALEAYAHKDLPFEKLIEELQPERSLNRTPLFQFMLNFRNVPRQHVSIGDLTFQPVAADTGIAVTDLTLELVEQQDGVSCSFEYSTDLFNAATIERMLSHFQMLLEGIVADPARRVSELPLLTADERYQLLVEWNATEAEYPKDRCIHELFEAQVAQTPDTVAVVFEDEQLTYRELNERANRVAHHLIKRGVKPGTLVGIYLGRSPEMVVAILGVLKAGGVYLPLDPEHPTQRLSFMLEDAEASVLLTQRRLAGRLAEHNARVVCLDGDWNVIATEDTRNPVTAVKADHPAYVIYTSGSTGAPKGIVGVHRGAVNRFSWMWETHPFDAREVCCQKTSLGFVDSVWEIFGPLLKGICLLIVPDETIKDSYRFSEVLARNNVTRLVLVPSLLKTLLLEEVPKRLPELKLWTTSGETLPIDVARRFSELAPDSTLLNIYGSSEVSADVTCYEVTSHSSASSSIPIGRPISNTQIYILDRHLQPTPVGVPGELHVGGAGLANGYLNRSALTAEKFIPNPFRSEPAARLYKTGDLARYLPDGNIEYLGRIDHQAKIRGFRIESGEIEAVIRQHPAVHESVVVTREDTPDDKRLVAYIVPNQRHILSASELRSHLKEKLPEYMVPSTFIMLDSLPLTQNGKVDRLALPALNPQRSELLDAYVAPRTETESWVAAAWADVLGVERVGACDDFFELGGHSLLAVQVIARIRDAFGVELPLREMFDTPTVANLAAAINRGRARAAGADEMSLMLDRLKALSEEEASALLSEGKLDDCGRIES